MSDCNKCKYISNTSSVHTSGWCFKLGKEIMFSCDRGKCKKFRKVKDKKCKSKKRWIRIRFSQLPIAVQTYFKNRGITK